MPQRRVELILLRQLVATLAVPILLADGRIVGGVVMFGERKHA